MKRAALIAAGFGIAVAQAATIARRQGGACSKYYIVNTRGTMEMQGPSIAFSGCNSQLQEKVPGGTEYNTEYPAGVMQMSGSGTDDIVSHVQSFLQQDPSTCFVLEGYSQGAMATINALPKLTDPATFAAIKAVMVVGSPAHPGGLESMMAPNVDQWKDKLLDICAIGDTVCGPESTPDAPMMGGHLSYPMSSSTQSKMADFAAQALNSATPAAGAGAGGSGGGGCSTPPPTSSSGGNGAAGSLFAGLKRLMLGGLGGSSGMGGLSSLMSGGAGGGNSAGLGQSATQSTPAAGGPSCAPASTSADLTSSAASNGASTSSTTLPTSASTEGTGGLPSTTSPTSESGASALPGLGSLMGGGMQNRGGKKRHTVFRIVKRLFAGLGFGLPSAHVLPGSIGASTGASGYGASIDYSGVTLTNPINGTTHKTWAEVDADRKAKMAANGGVLPPPPGLPPLPSLPGLPGLPGSTGGGLPASNPSSLGGTSSLLGVSSLGGGGEGGGAGNTAATGGVGSTAATGGTGDPAATGGTGNTAATGGTDGTDAAGVTPTTTTTAGANNGAVSSQTAPIARSSKHTVKRLISMPNLSTLGLGGGATSGLGGTGGGMSGLSSLMGGGTGGLYAMKPDVGGVGGTTGGSNQVGDMLKKFMSGMPGASNSTTNGTNNGATTTPATQPITPVADTPVADANAGGSTTGATTTGTDAAAAGNGADGITGTGQTANQGVTTGQTPPVSGTGVNANQGATTGQTPPVARSVEEEEQGDLSKRLMASMPDMSNLAASSGLPSLTGGTSLGSMMPKMPTVPTIPGIPSVRIPTIPGIPSIPSIPSIASIPSIPGIPSIPSMPSIPGIPSLGSVTREADKEATTGDVAVKSGHQVVKRAKQCKRRRMVRKRTKVQDSPIKPAPPVN